MRKTLLLLLITTMVASGCASLAEQADGSSNSILSPAPQIDRDPAFQSFYRSLFVADLHADTFLWGRPTKALTGETGRPLGHLDLRRLSQGNVALQVFSSVTQYGKTSRRNHYNCHDDADGNVIDTLLRAQGRYAAEKAYRARAIAQGTAAKQLANHTVQSNSPTRLTVLRDAREFEAFLQRWHDNRQVRQGAAGGTAASAPHELGAVLAIEGLHRDNASIDSVQALFGSDVRMMALTHHFDNELGGANTGCARTGLTELGGQVLSEISRQSVILDLAHASEKTAFDALDRLPRATSVVISHTGLLSQCNDSGYGRNISAALLRRVAQHDGVVGVMYADQRLCCNASNPCWTGSAAVVTLANAIRIALTELAEPEHLTRMREQRPDYDPADHVALGSDYDGSIRAVIGVEYLSALVKELRTPANPTTAALSDQTIRKLFGLNVCRIMAAGLPGGDAARSRSICARLAGA